MILAHGYIRLSDLQVSLHCLCNNQWESMSEPYRMPLPVLQTLAGWEQKHQDFEVKTDICWLDNKRTKTQYTVYRKQQKPRQTEKPKLAIHLWSTHDTGDFLTTSSLLAQRSTLGDAAPQTEPMKDSIQFNSKHFICPPGAIKRHREKQHGRTNRTSNTT